MRYIEPEMKISSFSVENVVTASGIGPTAQELVKAGMGEGVQKAHTQSWEEMIGKGNN